MSLQVTNTHGEVFVIPNPGKEVRAKLPLGTHKPLLRHQTRISAEHVWQVDEAQVAGEFILLKRKPIGVFRHLHKDTIHKVEEV